jgi:hypothetical protein
MKREDTFVKNVRYYWQVKVGKYKSYSYQKAKSEGERKYIKDNVN